MSFGPHSINVSFPDGNSKSFNYRVTAEEVIKSVSNSLARESVAVRINGVLSDLSTELVSDCSIEAVKADSPDGRLIINHSAAHILAMAVKHLFPNALPTIGPAINDGFYYDFFVSKPFSDDDRLRIQAEMKRIIKKGVKFERLTMSKKEAEKLYANNKFKLEILNEIEGDVVSFYKSGDFIDLCRGPHIPSSRFIKDVLLTKQSSAYWRGDEKRESLQRLYGKAFLSKKELDDYLVFLKEVKRRNHIRISKIQDLFGVYDIIGKGLPVFHPNGMIMRLELMKLIREVNNKLGFREVFTPHIAKTELFKVSGHYDHYKNDMFLFEHNGVEFGVKPMNCPFHIQIFKSKPRSYRDLPMRISEFATVYRAEKSGELNGLFRVIALTQDDGHIWLTESQVKDELKSMFHAVMSVYEIMGLKEFRINVSTRPDDFVGDLATWDKAERIIKEALQEEGISFVVKEGEGAFYGPKIDFDVKDAIGRFWQCGTIQLDFFMPQRFNMKYVGEDGELHTPLKIHRALFGSIERFMGILIEHFAGEYPTWLSPIQVSVIPVSDKFSDYAKSVINELRSAGLRVEGLMSDDSISKRVRDAEVRKIPYIIIVGEKEVNSNTISVRPRHGKPVMSVKLNDFKRRVKREINSRSLKLSY